MLSRKISRQNYWWGYDPPSPICSPPSPIAPRSPGEGEDSALVNNNNNNSSTLLILCTNRTVFVLQVGFFAWRTTSSSGEIFSINRRRADSFDVPSSLCSSISTVCKENFQAVKRRQDCACRCQATVNGSTFGYFNGGWRCVRGSDLRKQRRK